MRLYLDADVLVSLISRDAHTARAERLLSEHASWSLLVSDLGRAEFSAVMRRRARMGDISEADARTVFGRFDQWSAECTVRVDLRSSDMAAAEALLRRPDLSIRTPAALHVAIARRTGAPIATFDAKLAEAARVLGLSVLA